MGWTLLYLEDMLSKCAAQPRHRDDQKPDLHLTTHRGVTFS
jgi:hypothetical protein